MKPSAKPAPAAVVSVQEVACLLNVSRITVYKAIKAGQLPAARVGRKIVVSKKSLARFLGESAA
jgi:excisionase family DNA binding protein